MRLISIQCAQQVCHRRISNENCIKRVISCVFFIGSQAHCLTRALQTSVGACNVWHNNSLQWSVGWSLLFKCALWRALIYCWPKQRWRLAVNVVRGETRRLLNGRGINTLRWLVMLASEEIAPTSLPLCASHLWRGNSSKWRFLARNLAPFDWSFIHLDVCRSPREYSPCPPSPFPH